MKRSILLIAGAASICSAHASVLYAVTPFDPDLAFASDATAGQFNNQRLAEAFVLHGDSSLESLQWWGRSENSFFSDLRNFSTFTVSIFEDAGAIPGTEVFTSTVTTAALNPVQAGVDSSSVPIFSFDYNFGSALSLSRGTYWLSVGTTNVDPDGDGFYWSASQTRVSGNFAADGPVGSGSWNSSGFADLALVVNGQAVPEPASITAMALGSLLLLKRRRNS